MKLCPICATSYPADHRTCPTHGTVLVDTAELAPGTIVRDCYRIERTIGKGGMGTVYLAEHTLMKEPRALKFLSSALASNPTFVQRFLQEARAASKLRHANIAATLELGQSEDGSFYISMEYVDGPSLRALILQSPEGLPPARAFSIVHGVAEALGAAHAKRMVHRDIKPENILIAATPEGELPKVVDFGIVALNDGASLTQTGRPLLTAEYAAPEQWRGATPASELDGRTDLYSLGCMFFEMLTGQLPFHSDSYEGWFEQHVYTLPPSPSYIRPELARFAGLDALVLQLLAKEREQRPANVDAFLHDLNCVVAQGSGTRNLHREPTRTDLFVTGQGAAPPSEARRRTVLDVQTGRPSYDSGWSANTPPPNNDFQPHNAAAYLNSGAEAYQPYQPAQPNPAIPAYAEPAYSAPVYVAPVSRVAPQPAKAPLNRGALFAILGTFLLLTLGVVAAFLWLRNKQNLQTVQTVQTVQTGQTGQTGQTDQGSQQHLDTQPPPISSGAAAIPSPAPAPPQPSNPNGEPRPQPSTKTPAMPTDPVSIAAKAIALYNEKDYAAAGALLAQACTSGQADSCDYLGLMYQHKLGVSQDYGRAEAFYDKGCQAGSMAACSHLGNLYLNHLGVNQDYERALALYTRACNGDYADACQNLGSMYQFKKGVAQDFTRAVSLYGKACNNGSMNGCNSLGVLYQHSLGVQADFPKSVALYGKACEAGVADGCNNLGYMYQHAMGVDQDYTKAVALYSKACDGGNAFACNNLGIMYQSKQGVEQDYARAATYYAKACEGGSSNGCSDLGDLYRTGNGVAKDSDKARAYLSKGCGMGNQWGCEHLKQVE